MTIQIIASIVVIGVSIITLIIKFWKMMPYQQITEFDQLKAAKEVLDRSSDSFDEKLHPYTKEIASKVIARSDLVSAREIEYLLKLENPHQCIKDFVRSKNCFSPINAKMYQELEFIGIYERKCVRTFLKLIGVVLFFVYVLIACGPFVYIDLIIGANPSAGIILSIVLLIPSGFYMAWEAAKFTTKIVRAEILKDKTETYASSLENNTD